MPTKDIFSDVLHVNKFNVSWVAGNKCLYRGGNILQTVPFHDVFDYLLISLQIQMVLVTKPFSMTHNSASFDAHILLRTIQHYTTELLQTLRELNIHLLIVLSRSAT